MRTDRSLLLPLCFLSMTLPAVAATVTGTVTDRTTDKPAAGDTVALIAFGNGMQVAATTTTDAHGNYTLPVATPGTHLVRVDHQKATYFQPAPAGAHTVDVDVFDVAATVPGVVTEADVMSMQTDPAGLLEVTEDFIVRNDSRPPKTQFSEHAYEFYLPAGAKLTGSSASGPAGMMVASSPVSLPGPNHYSFVFPVRPGRSRFELSYTLPYAGATAKWEQREPIRTENLVVLLPKSMQLASGGANWQPVPQIQEASAFALKGIEANKGVQIAIRGTGQLPREAQGSDSGEAGDTAANGARPGGGLGPPIDTPDPLHKYKGWLLGGLGALLIAGAVLLMRGGGAAGAPTVPAALRKTPQELDEPEGIAASGETARPGSDRKPAEPLVAALEGAMLALEREHALGRVPAQEYAESRTALQGALAAALQRQANSPDVSNPLGT